MLMMFILTVAGSDLAGVYVSVHLTCVAQSFPRASVSLRYFPTTLTDIPKFNSFIPSL